MINFGKGWRSWGALGTAVAVLVQGAWLARAYPNAYLDADLLSYLAYYREWSDGAPALFGYTVPKVLPVALFGPTGSPEISLVLSLLIAAVGGAFLFLLAERTFGAGVAVLAAVTYVLDPLRSVLTLRSSADLVVGVGLLGAMYALSARRLLWASLGVLVASLAKPLAAVCGLAALLAPGIRLRHKLAAAALPFLALPAVAGLRAALDGGPVLSAVLSLSLPREHEAFVAVAQAAPLSWWGSLHLIFVDWFGHLLFARTWPLLLIGAGLYLIGSARPRGPSEAERESAAASLGDDCAVVLTVPLLLLAAYVVLASFEPFVLFTRFFWVMAAAASLLAGYGAVAVARHAPLPAWGKAALVGVFAFALFADRYDDFVWRERLSLAPFESHASLAARGVDAIADRSRCDGAAVVPLAYLPLAAWRAPHKIRNGELCALEDWAAGRGCRHPTCVLVMPAAPTTEVAREASRRLLGAGWSVEVADEYGALLREADGDGGGPPNESGFDEDWGRTPRARGLGGGTRT